MSTFKGRGIVLRETMVGEADKIVTLLMKERGKLAVSARGSRKPKSKQMAATQLFTYADFVIYDGGRFFSIAQAETIETFHAVCSSYEKLCMGSYFLELTDKTILDNMPCDEILLLLLRTLTVLSKEQVDIRLLRMIYEFKYLQYLGYAPEMERCSLCGAYPSEGYFGAEGYICGGCLGESPYIRISSSASHAIRYILNNDGWKLFSFKVRSDVLHDVEAASAIFIRSHIDIKFKSEELLR